MSWKEYPNKTKLCGLNSKYIVKTLGKELCKCSHEFFEDTTTDGRRTEIIKCVLARIGDERHYKVYANKLSDCPRPSDGGKWKSREWLYDLHWYKEVNDIKVTNLRSFIDMLKGSNDSDKLSHYLWTVRLNAEQRKTLDNYHSSGSSAMKTRKVVDQLLNDIIKGQSIYKRTRFNGKSLKDISSEASTLFNRWRMKLKKKLKKKSRAVSPEKILKRHNRLLLQYTYPEKVLSRNHEYLPTRLPLVAEIEWRPKRDEDSIVPYSGYKFDFQKLLVANADLRLMIFKINNKDEIKGLDDYFYKAIKSYTNLADNSQFLFIAFDEETKGLYHAEYPNVRIELPS